MRVIIFQLASSKFEEARDRAFLSMKDLESRGKQPELIYYDPVYSCEYNVESYEEITEQFNHSILETPNIHSLSVSDVIAIVDEEHRSIKAVYVDEDGYKQLPGFLEQMIMVNFPRDEESFYSGNGEGCWMTVTLEAKAAHDRDEPSGVYLGVLTNDVLYWGIPAGTVVPFELRGENRPVAFIEWLTEYQAGKAF